MRAAAATAGLIGVTLGIIGVLAGSSVLLTFGLAVAFLSLGAMGLAGRVERRSRPR